MKNMTEEAGLKRGLWCSADCDLEVFRQVPRELALAVVAGVVRRNRDELTQDLRDLGEDDAVSSSVREHIPDLGPVAEALRQKKLTGPPRRQALDRLGWSLRRANVFLSTFAPLSATEDPVIADRIQDLQSKVRFLADMVDDWTAPRVAAERKSA